MGTSFNPPRRSYIPDVREGFYNGDDPYQQARNNRSRAVAYGDMLNQQMQDFGDEEDYFRQYFRGEGTSAYGDIAEGRGGYRPDEQRDIIGRDGMDELQMTPEEREQLYLSEGEQAGVRGDPNQALRWFDPEWQDTINTEGNARIRENVDESGRSLNNTYNEDALSLSRGYRDELGNAVTSGAANVRGTLNRDRMTLDPNFIRDYRMSDRDVEDMTQQAALSQGNVSKGRADAIYRAAAQTGGMSPLALASGINELTTRGDQQANRAMLDARVAGKNMQAGRLRDVEGMRLDAEGNYADLASGAEMALGDRAYGAARDYETQRIGTEQDKQGRRYQIAANVADRGYDAVNQQNQNNVNNARYIGETGAELYNRADEQAAGRSRFLATNRQDAERYGQEARYGRGMDRNDRISGRTAGVVDARRGEEKEWRAYLAAQQGMANDNVNNTYANRIRNYGQAGQLAQGSTGDTMQYDLARRGQSFGTNFKQNAGRAIGSFVGNPTQWGKVGQN